METSAPAPSSEERKVEALLRLLDDPSAPVREAVSQELRALGKAGITLLENAAGNNEDNALALAASAWLKILGPISDESTFIDFIESFQYELETGCLMLDQTALGYYDEVSYYKTLDAMAARCKELLSTPMSAREQCGVLSRVIFGEFGFKGNVRDYHNPINSHLTQVVQRRLGIPITLCIVYMLVARRCGIDLEPVGLPGRFMVGCYTDAEAFYIDCFAQGVLLSKEDITQLLELNRIPPQAAYFAPTPVGEVLARMCRNLTKQHALAKDDMQAQRFAKYVGAFEDAYRKHSD